MANIRTNDVCPNPREMDRTGHTDDTVNTCPKRQTKHNTGYHPATAPLKYDADKPRPELIPPEALEEIAKVLAFGADKYAAGNWATGNGFAWSRLYGALLRHLYAWARGEDKDPESGLSHLAHAGCMLVFLIAHVRRKHGADDRTEVGVRPKMEEHQR